MKCIICGKESEHKKCKSCLGRESVIKSGKSVFDKILARKEELIKLFNDGKTISEMCSYFGCKHGPIRVAIKQLRLEPTYDILLKRKENKSKRISYKILNERFKTKEEKESYYKELSRSGRNKNFSVISKLNREFSKSLDELCIKNELEVHVGEYSYDLQVGNTLVEINPTISHCHSKSFQEITGKGSNKRISSNYHLLKTENAVKNGYSCVHIFDWEDKNKIITLFMKKERVFARNCEVKEIDRKLANQFLEENHIQSSCRGNKVNIALFYNNAIVQVMTFGKPRYNKKYDWELLRLCSKKDIVVIGGASKLFKSFLKKYDGNIISYCDLSKFNGKVYEELGFSLLRQTSPTRHWFNEKTKVHITEALLRQRGYDQLFNANYGKGTSNENLMFENGFLDVYDCGQKVFTYDKERFII